VKDQPVTQIAPALAREELDQVLLDPDRVGVRGQPESAREATNVGVDNDTFVHSEGISENDIRRLSANSGKGRKGSEGLWDLTGVISEQGAGHGLNGFGLVSEKPGGVNKGLEFIERDLCVVLDGAAA
jgi:hypothetical protein